MNDLIQALMVIPDGIKVIGITPYGDVPSVQVDDSDQALEWVKTLSEHSAETVRYSDSVSHFYTGHLPGVGDVKKIKIISCRREGL
jgi:hypothetical protein